MATRNEFVSFHPVHPGEILNEELLERGITSKELAGRVGISPQNMSDYITGRRSFTVDFSCKLEEVLGIKARMWMDLQANYEITKRRVEGLSEECQRALQDGVTPQRISARVEWTAAGQCQRPQSTPALRLQKRHKSPRPPGERKDPPRT